MRVNTPEEALELLKKGNRIFIDSDSNPAKDFIKARKYTFQNGQNPYAAILTCSDSRIPAEHIFSAGIGELFVIRVAGNVIGDFELGSIEYACELLGAKVVVVMGHTQCGAIRAAIEGNAHGYILSIVDEIKADIGEIDDVEELTNYNIKHGIGKILGSQTIKSMLDEKKIIVASAIYDIETGAVKFLDE